MNQVEKSVYNIRANRALLSPVLHLVRSNKQLLPNIDRVIEKLLELYGIYDLKPLADAVYHEAWTLRQLISLLKGEFQRLITEHKKGATRKCKELGPLL